MEKNNKIIKIGDSLKIHSYKHDGTIYRSWDQAVVLDVKPDYIVLGNKKVLVMEKDGRTWRTKEPAIIFFYKNNWFNIICQLKEKGIYYYCNIATPYIVEESTIKYIDYDLDLRIFPDGKYKILDQGEYEHHRHLMNYSNEINQIVKNELKKLILLYKERKDLFDQKIVSEYQEKIKDYF